MDAKYAAPKSIVRRRVLARLVFAAVFLLTAAFFLAQSATPAEAGGSPQMGPTRSMSGPTPENWVILPTMGADATQADYGEQYYILVCRSCHGDVGRGLTAEWISQWAPRDQNCWQSKCHSPNHPPDGFEIPMYVPPVMGEDALRRFATAADLYTYTRQYMPWQEPGSLQDVEYWQVTAFLLRENNVALPEVLDETTASSIRLREAAVPAQATVPVALEPTSQPTPLQEPVEHPAPNNLTRWLPLALGIVIAVPFAVWLLRRGR